MKLFGSSSGFHRLLRLRPGLWQRSAHRRNLRLGNGDHVHHGHHLKMQLGWKEVKKRWSSLRNLKDLLKIFKALRYGSSSWVRIIRSEDVFTTCNRGVHGGGAADGHWRGHASIQRSLNEKKKGKKISWFLEVLWNVKKSGVDFYCHIPELGTCHGAPDFWAKTALELSHEYEKRWKVWF